MVVQGQLRNCAVDLVLLHMAQRNHGLSLFQPTDLLHGVIQLTLSALHSAARLIYEDGHVTLLHYVDSHMQWHDYPE